MIEEPNTFLIIADSCMFAGALIAMILGIMNISKMKALYAKFITFGMGCFAMSYLFELLKLFSEGTMITGFQLGVLGRIGGMAFLFSASYGQIDGLVDDHTKTFQKYRNIAMIAPLIILLIALPVLLANIDIESKIVMVVESVFVAGAAYYNFKHIVIPDVDFGIVKVIKSYNITALILEVLISLELMATYLGNNTLTMIFGIALGVVFITIIPVLKQGVRKWTI